MGLEPFLTESADLNISHKKRFEKTHNQECVDLHKAGKDYKVISKDLRYPKVHCYTNC